MDDPGSMGSVERIGDLCVNICERVIELNEEPPLPPVADLESLAGEAISVVHEALDTLEGRGWRREHRFEIPHGPICSFEGPDGHRVALYQLTRPEVAAHFEGRRDF